VGVRHGETSEYLLKNTKNLNLVLVDPYPEYQDLEHHYSVAEQEGIKAKTVERLSPYSDRFQFVHRPSVAASEMYRDATFDWAFIDAEHTYSACKADINAWWPKIKNTGALLLHDASMRPVSQAVREFVNNNDLALYQTGISTDIFCIWKS
jgi:hypothetical protein